MAFVHPRAKRDHIIFFSILGAAAIGGGTLLYILKRSGDAGDSANCASNMKAVCLAAWLWANDRNDFMPTNFICMSNEVVTPKVLHCRADHTRREVSSWEKFTEDKSSYAMVSPGIRAGTTNGVFIRCRIHGHLGIADGSLLNATRTKLLRKHSRNLPRTDS
jgi:hypothetical protein